MTFLNGTLHRVSLLFILIGGENQKRWRLNMSRRIVYEEVKDTIEELGYKIITGKHQYVKSTEKIRYVCNCGSGLEIKQTFTHFKRGKGRVCAECTVQFKGNKRRTYEDVVAEIHRDGVCEVVTSKKDYIDTNQKISLRCKCGDIFYASVHDYKSSDKKQCNVCGNNHLRVEEFISFFEELESRYGCKLLEYSSDKGYITHRSELKIQCECGELFKTIMNSVQRYHKVTCNKCSKIVSKGEDRIRTYLINNGIEFEMQHTFSDCRGKRKPLPFDFAVFDEKRKFLIEYDGIQHFEPREFGMRKEETLQSFREIQANDQIKNQYCIDNDIPLIRIPYWEFDNIEHILFDALVEHGLLECIT